MDCAIWDPFSGSDLRATGDPRKVYARRMELIQVAEQLGFEFGLMPVDEARRSLEMFGEHVLPEVSRLPVRF